MLSIRKIRKFHYTKIRYTVGFHIKYWYEHLKGAECIIIIVYFAFFFYCSILFMNWTFFEQQLKTWLSSSCLPWVTYSRHKSAGNWGRYSWARLTFEIVAQFHWRWFKQLTYNQIQESLKVRLTVCYQLNLMFEPAPVLFITLYTHLRASP